jgi:hypothetical protein
MPRTYSEAFLKRFAAEIMRQVEDAMRDAAWSGTSYRVGAMDRMRASLPEFIRFAKKSVRYELGQGSRPGTRSSRRRILGTRKKK